MANEAEWIKRYQMHKDILLHTIDHMDMESGEKEKLIRKVEVKYHRYNMILYCKMGEGKNCRKEFYKIVKARQIGIQDLKNIIKIICIKLNIGNF